MNGSPHMNKFEERVENIELRLTSVDDDIGNLWKEKEQPDILLKMPMDRFLFLRVIQALSLVTTIRMETFSGGLGIFVESDTNSGGKGKNE